MLKQLSESAASFEPPRWRQIMRENFTCLDALADFLKLDSDQKKAICQRPNFTLNLPRRLASKILKSSLNDPILKQFVPLEKELEVVLGFVADPVGDQCARKTSKLLHKYKGRALILCTSACAMHCRYCFRQHFEYSSFAGFATELELITSDSTIHEVILSGGDPLSLSDSVLTGLLDSLQAIPHVKRIRFHTRFPIGIPERINDSFLSLLEACTKQIWMIIHTNHARELDEDIFLALRAIRQLGIPVLNHTVLLRGINDSVEVLEELCSTLIDNGITPYYINQLDPVEGGAHFEVSVEEGLAIMNELAKRLPGYGVPRYAREIAGEPYKSLLKI